MARGDDEQELQRVIPPGAAEAEEALVDSGADDPAVKEATQLSRGASARDLERETKEKEHDRGEAFKDHFEWLSIRALDGLFAAFFLLGAVLIFHMLLPAHQDAAGVTHWIHGWLTHEQLDDIKGLLAGGIIAGLVADHFKKRMG